MVLLRGGKNLLKIIFVSVMLLMIVEMEGKCINVEIVCFLGGEKVGFELVWVGVYVWFGD